VQVNAGRDQTHHHGVLSGLGAGAAAVLAGVLFAAVLVLAVWHHVAGQLSAAVQVIVWTLTAAVVTAVAAGMVYAFLFLRHRALHPETLARPVVRAEVIEQDKPPEIPPATPVAELPAGPLWRVNPRATIPEPDDSRKRT
jgi:MFS superfamily sulfate permease-like transporter